MTTFHSSDHHFFHNKIIEFGRKFNTIDEHNEYIVQQHNSVVGHDDICWFHGDVMLNSDDVSILHRMNGKKRLILGNHDTSARIQKYISVFEKIVAYEEVRIGEKKIILSHVPVHTSQLGRWVGNIHGHLHSEVLPDVRYICVSMEQLDDYKPVSQKHLFKTFKERGVL